MRSKSPRKYICSYKIKIRLFLIAYSTKNTFDHKHVTMKIHFVINRTHKKYSAARQSEKKINFGPIHGYFNLRKQSRSIINNSVIFMATNNI